MSAPEDNQADDFEPTDAEWSAYEEFRDAYQADPFPMTELDRKIAYTNPEVSQTQ